MFSSWGNKDKKKKAALSKAKDIKQKLQTTYNELNKLSQEELEKLLYTSVLNDYNNYYGNITKIKKDQLEAFQKIANYLDDLTEELSASNTDREAIYKNINKINTDLETIANSS